ncbi:MAG: ATP-binding protein [Bacteroidales bacterium]|jgi:signal transduction histidine kinase|nr:ATP-binding protein [Bacteroidales bacterium]MDD3099950.1 ATP-binding protein [Bacteroidales bacterium]MDD3638770.1 ATP-binding protein [Bacteroidales bacterium]MDD3943451.1 ATP-binding protein [Bacteroidales bacterium]MDD4479943.1 ATP-binding protein [Bacteroidales bacterium]
MKHSSPPYKRKSISYTIAKYVFAGSALILVIILGLNYSNSKKHMTAVILEKAQHQTEEYAGRINEVFVAAQRIPTVMASQLNQMRDWSSQDLSRMLESMLLENPDIFGAAIAFEPGIYEGLSHRAPYAYRTGTGVASTLLFDGGKDYFMEDWYMVPARLEEPFWSDPYFEASAGQEEVLMITYSVPFFAEREGKRVVAGVTTVDISLRWINSLMENMEVYETGYGFLITNSGRYVYHPDQRLRMNETTFSAMEDWIIRNGDLIGAKADTVRQQQFGVYRKMLAGESGLFMDSFMFPDWKEKAWFAYAPVRANGWSLALVYPREEALSELHSLNTILIIVGLFSLFVLFGFVFIIARILTLPVINLTKYAKSVAESGDYTREVPELASKDEIGELAGSFSVMMHEIEEAQRTLEDRVKERTAQLVQTQEQLVQSEKMASLGQLTAGVAHEIKNPLNFINNFSELSVDLAKELNEALVPVQMKDEDRSYIKEILGDLSMNAAKILEHGKRADSIVKGMLLHSRGKSGEFQLADINNMLTEDIALGYHGMRAQDNSFNITIEEDLDKELPQVSVVPQDLSRVFLNLINNACYSVKDSAPSKPQGWVPTLRVSSRKEGDMLEVRIRDNGKGISQENIKKIFDPFFTTKPAGKGTGLGLSLSYDIVVKVHNGQIRVESEPGEYAEFIVTIPVKQ